MPVKGGYWKVGTERWVLKGGYWKVGTERIFETKMINNWKEDTKKNIRTYKG